jgi:hypothetical protein
LVTGDTVQHPWQLLDATGPSVWDVDPTEAARTRRRLLGHACDRRTLVLGTHFSGPTAGRLVPDGDGFWFAA